MKAYVIPIQNACNANCAICITRYRKESEADSFGEKMNILSLTKLQGISLDKIEITGGGEPLLHPQINDIIEGCASFAPTQLYTNGLSIDRLNQESFVNLRRLCISRFHYDDEINARLMGKYIPGEIIKKASSLVEVKLSLVLRKGGIENATELKEYLDWASENGVNNVVVRQMFDFDYPNEIQTLKVKSEEVLSNLDDNFTLLKDDEQSSFLNYGKVYVEVEKRSNCYEKNNLVLRPNGTLYQGWGEDVYEQRNI